MCFLCSTILSLLSAVLSCFLTLLSSPRFLILLCPVCCSVVVLIPTRELALQTSAVLRALGKHLPLNIIVTTGGTNLRVSSMEIGRVRVCDV